MLWGADKSFSRPNEEVFGKFFTAKEDGFSVHQYCLVRKRNFLITTLFKERGPSC